MSKVGSWPRVKVGAVKEGFLEEVSSELRLEGQVRVSQRKRSEKNVLGGESSIGIMVR